MKNLFKRAWRRGRSPATVRLNLERLEDRLSPFVHEWTGLGGDNLWSNNANWTNNAPSVGTETNIVLVFHTNPTTAGANVMDDDLPNLVVENLLFDANPGRAGATTFALGGQAASGSGYTINTSVGALLTIDPTNAADGVTVAAGVSSAAPGQAATETFGASLGMGIGGDATFNVEDSNTQVVVNGPFNLGNNNLTVTNQGASVIFNGAVSSQSIEFGVGSITKTGPGTLDLVGTATYAGDTVVTGGTLLVDGTADFTTARVTPAAGARATLGGLGEVDRVAFDTTANPGNLGAVIAPGDGPDNPGTFTVVNPADFDAGTTLSVQLNDTTHFSQISSDGGDLGNARLSLAQSTIFPGGTQFVLMSQGDIPVTGAFSNVASGGVVATALGQQFVIQNNGGNTLTATALAFTSTTATAAPPSVPFGQPVNLTATVEFPIGTTAAGGTVTFSDEQGVLQADVPINFSLPPPNIRGVPSVGMATITVPSLPVGTHTITAVYSGDGVNSGSNNRTQTAGNIVVVLGLTTTTVSAPAVTVFEQPVNLTATVEFPIGTTAAGGTVTFSDEQGVLQADVPINFSLPPPNIDGGAPSGTATITVPLLPVGVHTITAVYSGDPVNEGSPSVGNVVNVLRAPTILTVALPSGSSSVWGNTVVITAAVAVPPPSTGSPIGPTGAVVFFVVDTTTGAVTVLGASAMAGGVAAFFTTTLPPGAYLVSGVYVGDGNFAPGGAYGVPLTVQDPEIVAELGDGSLVEQSAVAGVRMIAPAGSILFPGGVHTIFDPAPPPPDAVVDAGNPSVSAVLDRTGHTDIFAVGGNGALLEYNGFGLFPLAGGPFLKVSATRDAAGDGVAYAVADNGSLWNFSPRLPGGAAPLTGPGAVLSVSAVTDAAGDEIVYAIMSDHHLYVHVPFGWVLLSGASWTSIGAGLNPLGQPIVAAVMADHSLWVTNTQLGFVELGGPGTAYTAEADANGNVFAILTDQHLWRFGAAGPVLLSADIVTSFSVAQPLGGRQDVFATFADSSLSDFLELPQGDFFQNLFPSGVLGGAAG